jgi:hypothetical protein
MTAKRPRSKYMELPHTLRSDMLSYDDYVKQLTIRLFY